ncbi:hypothetical protein [Methanobrevibacter filiformis]|uniref:hypothetical protein n=1 Tax=Methanobrevibacter filiformis TaxID=55758 RepID=UPI000AE93750|nr:hypothetical protein [Methanobrevibacter filiformis]
MIDFDNVEFISRAFAQEHIYQKHKVCINLIEKNMVENMLNIVEEDYVEIF